MNVELLKYSVGGRLGSQVLVIGMIYRDEGFRYLT
jgi:hypothetical protein